MSSGIASLVMEMGSDEVRDTQLPNSSHLALRVWWRMRRSDKEGDYAITKFKPSDIASEMADVKV